MMAEAIIELGSNEMPDATHPIDLPPSVAAELVRTGVSAHQSLMADVTGNIANINNIVRGDQAQSARELGSLESRANSGVMATPIASPTTQSGG